MIWEERVVEKNVTAGIDEFKVMTSGAFTAAYLELIPQLGQVTRKKIVTAATSIGTGPTSILNRLKSGEVVDLVIVADAAFSILFSVLKI